MTSAVVAIALGAAAARAQSAEAEQLFNDGNALMKQGKLGEACEAFEASNRIEQRAGTLIRLGECREQNGQLASAWSAYKDSLTRVKDVKKKALATTKVKQLEGKLSYLTVTVGDDSRIDGLVVTRNGQSIDPGVWNRAVPVNGGEYVIAGKAPGRDDWSQTVQVPTSAGKVSVAVPKLKESPKKPPPPVVAQTPPSTIAPVSPTPTAPIADQGEPSMWTTRRQIAVGVAGVAVASVVTGIIIGGQARSKQDEAHMLCPNPMQPCAGAARADSLIKQGQDKALLANIAFGAAGAAAVVAGVLWFTGGPERPSHGVAVMPSFGSGEAGVAFVGRF